MTETSCSAAAAAVSVIVLETEVAPSVNVDDVQVVELFDGTTKITLTLLDAEGNPIDEPVVLEGFDPFVPAVCDESPMEKGLVPCAFGDSYTEVAELTAAEAEFYNQFMITGVDWTCHVGEFVLFTAEIIGTGFVRLPTPCVG